MDYAQTNRFLDNLAVIIAKFSTKDVFSHITEVSADVLQQRLNDANCLFNPKEFAVNADVINEYFGKLFPLFERFFKENRRDLNILDNASKSDKIKPGEFLRKLLSKDAVFLASAARRLNIKLDFLTLFALYFQRPFLATAGVILKEKIALDKWEIGYCPVCGAWPAFGKIPEDPDLRMLWCIHCDTEWSFSKLRCPFCRNENAEDLKFFTVEDMPKYRVNVCEKCRRYIKLRDCKRVPETTPIEYDREYLVSSPLDLTAMENGYIREYLFFSGIPTMTTLILSV